MLRKKLVTFDDRAPYGEVLINSNEKTKRLRGVCKVDFGTDLLLLIDFCTNCPNGLL